MDTGIIVAFAGNNVPSGWALCDGRSVSSKDAQFRRLFDVIGTIHGGDANPNFQLPDYRGYFLRGTDRGAARDPEAAGRTAPGKNNTGNLGPLVGSVQDEQFHDHLHATAGFHLEASGGTGFDGAGFASNSNPNSLNRNYGTTSAGGAETRPKNVYVDYIIKL
jgi:hypothetical protein